MKKIINAPADVVDESLAGLVAAHPDLVLDVPNRVVSRAGGPRAGKVGLVSGGGAGHEPLHSGFVGLGMLDAAISGEVFTSPVPDQILAATALADGGAGVLHIVKNYTGDVLNFEIAAELAAADTGTEVVAVVVDDDVAVQDSLYTAGRRGVGLTVLLEKIVGAAAEEGRDLAAVADLARHVIANGRTMGLALTSCTTPAAGHPTFDLGEDEIEVGVGIHGEPGRRRVPLMPASEIARTLLEPVLEDLPAGEDPVIVFVNGLGGTPLIELYLLYNEVAKLLAEHSVTIARSLVGPYITSLDMAGASVTLLRANADVVALWDAPVNTPACVGAPEVADGLVRAENVQSWLASFGTAVVAEKDHLTQLDSAIGDADHGANLDRGMAAVVTALGPGGSDPAVAAGTPGAIAKATGMTLIRTVGGASGPLYGTFFLRFASAAGDAASLDGAALAAALRAGVEGIAARGRSAVGDKTMLDTLFPALDALDGALAAGSELAAALVAAADAAESGRDATIPLVAHKGRASYLGERSAGHADPGATSAALLVRAAVGTLG